MGASFCKPTAVVASKDPQIIKLAADYTTKTNHTETDAHEHTKTKGILKYKTIAEQSFSNEMTPAGPSQTSILTPPIITVTIKSPLRHCQTMTEKGLKPRPSQETQQITSKINSHHVEIVSKKSQKTKEQANEALTKDKGGFKPFIIKDDGSSFSSQSDYLLGSIHEKTFEDSLKINAKKPQLSKPMHLMIPQQVKKSPERRFLMKEGSCNKEMFKKIDYELIAHQTTEKLNKERRKSNAHANPATNSIDNQLLGAYHRHFTGQGRKTECTDKKEDFVEIAVGELCRTSNQSSSRGNEGKPKNDNSQSSNDNENKKGGSRYYKDKPSVKIVRLNSKKHSEIMTSYFPNDNNGESRKSQGDQPSPPQSLKDFFQFRNSSSHDANSSKNCDQPGDKSNQSFDNKFGKLDVLSMGSLKKGGAPPNQQFLRQISNVTFLKPQSSIRLHGHNLGFNENDSQMTSSSPQFLNKHQSPKTAAEPEFTKSILKVNREIINESVRSEKSKSLSNSTLKTNSSLEDEEEEEERKAILKKRPQGMHGGTGDPEDNKPLQKNQAKKFNGRKGFNDDKQEEKKDGEQEYVPRFLHLQTFKDWVDYPRESPNIFKTPQMPMIQEPQHSPENYEEIKYPSIRDSHYRPSIVIVPPNQDQYMPVKSNDRKIEDDKNHSATDQLTTAINVFKIEAMVLSETEARTPPLHSPNKKQLLQKPINSRSITPKNQRNSQGLIQLVGRQYYNSRGQVENHQPINLIQRSRQLPFNNDTRSISSNTKSNKLETLSMSQKALHQQRQKQKELLKRSCSDGIEQKEASRFEYSQPSYKIKRGDRENVAMLEQICDSVMNQIFKFQSQMSINSSSNLVLQDSSKGGSIRTMNSNFRMKKHPMQAERAKTLQMPWMKEVSTPQGANHGPRTVSRDSDETDNFTPANKSSNEIMINVIAPEETTSSLISGNDQSLARSSGKNEQTGETGGNHNHKSKPDSEIKAAHEPIQHYSTIMELPEEEMKSTTERTTSIGGYHLQHSNLTVTRRMFSQDSLPKYYSGMTEKSSQLDLNTQMTIKENKNENSKDIRLPIQTLPPISSAMKTAGFSRSSGGLIQKAREQQKEKQQINSPITKNQSNSLSAPGQSPAKIQIPIDRQDSSDFRKRIMQLSKDEINAMQSDITDSSVGKKSSQLLKQQLNNEKSRNFEVLYKPYQKTDLPPKSISKLKDQTIILASESIPNDHTYKFSHNSPNVKGRNLINSIKRVAQKCDNKDLTQIPNLLQQVRLQTLKQQVQKQFMDSANLIHIKNNDTLTKFPRLINMKRQSTLDYEYGQDSERLILFNKNTMDDDQNHNRFEEIKYAEEQSCYSQNTPNNQEHPFYFGHQYDKMFSPTSSIRTPDASVYGGNGYKEFNPADYSYEIHYDTTFDNITSAQSKDSPTNKNWYSYPDQNSQVSTPHTQYNQYLQSSSSPINGGKISKFAKQPNQHRGMMTVESFKVNRDQNSQFVYSLNPQLTNGTEQSGANNRSSLFKKKERQQSITQLNMKSGTPHANSQSTLSPLQLNNSRQQENMLIPRINIMTHSSSSSLKQQQIYDGSHTQPNGKVDNMVGQQSTNNYQFQHYATYGDDEKIEETTPKPEQQTIQIMISKLTDDNISLSNGSSNYQAIKDDVEAANMNRSRRASTTKFPGRTRKTSHTEQLYNHMGTISTPKTDHVQTMEPQQTPQNNNSNLRGSHTLSPYNDFKSPRSITTISAISTKVNGKKLINQYIIIQTVGRGKFSKVAQCMDQNTKQIFAMKVMNKLKLKKIFISKSKHAYHAVETEIAILKKLDHPHIVKLFEIIDDPKHDKLYLITEYVKNGTLLQKLNFKPKPSQNAEAFLLGEDFVRKYFRQLIIAVEYCHENAKIIHRDIKPENILLDENDNVKLSDFGVSFMMENGSDNIETSAGSYYYYSPEACLGATYKGRKSDIWACGVTLYYMIYRHHPFESTHIPDLFKKIQNDEPSYRPMKPGQIIFNVSSELRELMKNILTKNPENRITIPEIKKHPWITNNGVLPMQELEKQMIQASEQEISNAFGKVNIIGNVILKKLANMQNGMANSSTNKTQAFNLLTNMFRMGPPLPSNNNVSDDK